MSIVVASLLGFVGVLLILVGSLRIKHSNRSLFELERRAKTGNESAVRDLEREQMLIDLYSLRRVTGAVLLVSFVWLSFVGLTQVWAIVASFAMAILYGAVARLSVFQSASDRLCKRFEPAFLRFIKKWPMVFSLIRGVKPETSATELGSRHEFIHLVEQSNDILSPDEKKLIENALRFDDKKIRDVMVPRDHIQSIAKRELLGPLALDELHKTGHTRFPVTDGGLDHIIGVLHIQDLLIVDARQRSSTAEKAMEPGVFYIRSDWSLSHALTAMIESHRHLFVVVDETQKTAGLVSLQDVMEALLGRKVVGKFDQHDNLRAVASYSPKDVEA